MIAKAAVQVGAADRSSAGVHVASGACTTLSAPRVVCEAGCAQGAGLSGSRGFKGTGGMQRWHGTHDRTTLDHSPSDPALMHQHPHQSLEKSRLPRYLRCIKASKAAGSGGLLSACPGRWMVQPSHVLFYGRRCGLSRCSSHELFKRQWQTASSRRSISGYRSVLHGLVHGRPSPARLSRAHWLSEGPLLLYSPLYAMVAERGCCAGG